MVVFKLTLLSKSEIAVLFELMLAVLALTLFVKASSAAVARVTSAVMLEVAEATRVSIDATSFVLAVILAVLD